MSFLLIVILLLVQQNESTFDDINERHNNDSFDINIGAGYGVEISKTSEFLPALPRSTTTVNHSTNHLSKLLSDEIFNESTRPSRNIITENPEAIFENNVPAYIGDDIPNYGAYENRPEPEINGLNVQPDLEEIQTVVNNLEDSEYSKVVQVVKVPAVYEIHLQSNIKKKKKRRHELKPPNNYQNTKQDKNTNNSNEAYIKWLNNYYSKRKESFTSKDNKHKTIENFNTNSDSNDYTLNVGNILHFGEVETSGNDHVYKQLPENNQPASQWQSRQKPKDLFNQPPKFSTSSTFRNNKEIFGFKQPQALYEVPAPYLGNYNKPRPFRNTKNFPSGAPLLKKIKPSQSVVHSSVNVYSTLTPSVPFDYRINKKSYVQMQNVPDLRQNQNLVYGKPIDQVLSPQKIGLQHREDYNNIIDNENSYNYNENYQDVYFTTDKSNMGRIMDFQRSYPRASTTKKRNSKYMYHINRRNSFSNRRSQVPVDYVITARIKEKYISGGDK